MRFASWAILVATAFPGLACTDSGRSHEISYKGIYPVVLERVAKELDLSQTLALHPFLGHLDWATGDTVVRIDTFSRFDAYVVSSVVDAHSSEYHLCTLTPQKNCDPSEDKVHVILSEPADLGVRSLGVLALVVDHRSGSKIITKYVANLRAGGNRWRLATFREVNF
jgi:hypothetical protein